VNNIAAISLESAFSSIILFSPPSSFSDGGGDKERASEINWLNCLFDDK
jgi:hypothetical protein